MTFSLNYGGRKEITFLPMHNTILKTKQFLKCKNDKSIQKIKVKIGGTSSPFLPLPPFF